MGCATVPRRMLYPSLVLSLSLLTLNQFAFFMSFNVRVCVSMCVRCECVCARLCLWVCVRVTVSTILTSQAAIPLNSINFPFSNNLPIHTLNLNFQTSIRANVVFFLALPKSRLWRV